MRLVLEEVFRDAADPQTGKPIKVKIGEIVIYSSQLDAPQLDICKTWPKKYKDKLKEHGFVIE